MDYLTRKMLADIKALKIQVEAQAKEIDELKNKLNAKPKTK